MILVETFGLIAACLALAGIYFALKSAIQSTSPKKEKLRFTAFICIGSCIYGIAFSLFTYNAKLPILEISGEIEQAQVHSEGKGHRTTLQVRIPAGEVTVNASGISPFFHAGQRMTAKYQGVTGHILKAHFINTNGQEVGVFNGTDTLFPYWLLLSGSLVIFAGYKMHKRDTERAHRV